MKTSGLVRWTYRQFVIVGDQLMNPVVAISIADCRRATFNRQFAKRTKKFERIKMKCTELWQWQTRCEQVG